MKERPHIDERACLIRQAEPKDRNDLLRIARGTWGGSDYLPRVMEEWSAEPWFLVCEYKGHAVGCLKMTMFPDNVLWFEGLRVLSRYQNRGIATLLNRWAFAIAAEEKRTNPRLSFEFCTYYLNAESLHLTEKMGFQTVTRFYTMNKRVVTSVLEPKIIRDFDLSWFHRFRDYIPCAWQSVHKVPDSLPFLRKHGYIIQTPHAAYYCGGHHERDITLLEPPGISLAKDLPYLQHCFGSRKGYSIIFPAEFKDCLPLLEHKGFRFWEGERVENMLILKL